MLNTMLTLLPTKSSQTSLLPSFFQAEEARRFDGMGHTYITQEALVREYGKGRSGRAKCPLCGGLHLSATQDGRFYCFNCGDTKGLYWRFRADGLLAPPHRDNVSYLYSKDYFFSTPSSTKTSLACKTTLDTVYRALLDLCPLTSLHQTHLKERGFSFDSREMMLGSLPDGRGQRGAAKRTSLVMALLEKTGLSRDEIACVSGFYLDKRKKLRLGGTGGLLLPVFDTFGHIVGMQIRSMGKNAKSRYTWLSSTKEGGVSGGAPTGFLAGSDPRSDQIAITEGFFKSVALQRHLSGIQGILSMAGVGMLPQLLERLDELQGIKRAQLWFDADFMSNPNVLKALAKAIRSLRSHGLEVEVKGWDIAKGKGIDDYLAKGHKIEEVRSLCPDHIVRSATLRKSTANLISSNKVGRLITPILPDAAAILADKLSLTKEQMYKNTDEAMLKALGLPMGTFILHDGPTGSGKSRAALLRSEEGTLYVVDNYKLLFEIAKECEALGVSYQILYGRGDRVRENADLETQARQTRIWEAAGCENIEKARELGERGHFPCHGCPLFEQKQADGKTPACRYWQQRKEATEKAGKTLTLTLIQTLVSNHQMNEELGGQLNLEGKGGVNTVIFDDIKGLMSHLARPQDVTRADLQEWEVEIAKKDHKGVSAYGELLKELRRLLWEEQGIPSKPSLEALYKAGRRARDAFDQEAKFFQLFKPEADKRPVLNALEPLAYWLSEGEWINVQGEGEERRLRFLRPSGLVPKLAKSRVIYLDATPDTALMSWVASSLGMQYKQTRLPQPTQQIIQLPEILWTEEQLANSPEAKALHEYVSSQKGFILTKKALASGDEGYFGRDERGLNNHQNAPVTLLAGHHMMSAEQAGQAAWLYRAFAHHRKTPLEVKAREEGSETQLRTYGDPWRPWKRSQHVLSDPLAEQIRSHHYSATILQGVARDRDPEKKKFVLAGSPIELNGKPYPVSLWTLTELREHLEGEGVDVLTKSEKVPAHISRLNEARQEKRDERILELASCLVEKHGLDALNNLAAVRALLGERRCEGNLAKEVLWAISRFVEKQGLMSKTQVGGTGLLINTKPPVSPMCFFESEVERVEAVDASTEDTNFRWVLFGEGEEAEEAKDEIENGWASEGYEEAEWEVEEEAAYEVEEEAACEVAERVCEEETPLKVSEGVSGDRSLEQPAKEAQPLEMTKGVCEEEMSLEGQEGVFGEQARAGCGEVALAEPEEPLRAFVSCDEGRTLATKKGERTPLERVENPSDGLALRKAGKRAGEASQHLPMRKEQQASEAASVLSRAPPTQLSSCKENPSDSVWRDFGQ